MLASASPISLVSAFPKRVKARPKSKRPLPSAALRSLRALACVATLSIWTSKFLMYVVSSSNLRSSGVGLGFIPGVAPSWVLSTLAFFTVCFTHPMKPCCPSPSEDGSSSQWARSDSSSVRNLTKCADVRSSRCRATRSKKRSKFRLRVSTNSSSNRLSRLFSGKGGMMAPGNSLLSSLCSTLKWLNLRITLKDVPPMSGRLLCVLTLYVV
mmetsp:Transcript_4375/g.17194  ORF Transcript_4375/g.17194 Transcript_4375/m.17194 type:complete len:211 (-) Transcript_4375:148-780(-)